MLVEVGGVVEDVEVVGVEDPDVVALPRVRLLRRRARVQGGAASLQSNACRHCKQEPETRVETSLSKPCLLWSGQALHPQCPAFLGSNMNWGFQVTANLPYDYHRLRGVHHGVAVLPGLDGLGAGA